MNICTFRMETNAIGSDRELRLKYSPDRQKVILDRLIWSTKFENFLPWRRTAAKDQHDQQQNPSKDATNPANKTALDQQQKQRGVNKQATSTMTTNGSRGQLQAVKEVWRWRPNLCLLFFLLPRLYNSLFTVLLLRFLISKLFKGNY